MPQLQTREIDLFAAEADGDLIPCVLATEAPVDRGNYLEVLSHAPADVDLSRAPLPLIVQHNHTELNVGVVEQIRISGKQLKGMARFGASPRAKEILADVKAGVVRSLSVGYELVRAVSEAGTTVRFAWAPYECSVVSVPADPHAGFYRSFSKGNTMSEASLPTPETADHQSRSQRRAALANQRLEEVTDIITIGESYNAIDLAAQFVRQGRGVEDFKAALLARMSNKPLDTADFIGMSDNEVGRYSILRAVRAMSDPNYRQEAGLEIEASRAVAKQLGRDPRGLFVPGDALMRRDLNVGTAAAGGHTVATDLLASSFIDVLRNRTQVFNLGATLLPGLVGNVAIPRKTSGSTGYWVAEGGSANESQAVFDQVSLSPKSVSGYMDITRRLLLQSSLDVEALVRNDLAATLAEAIDAAAILGGGANEPTGILGTAGIGSVAGGANGAAPTWAHIVDLESAVATANADMGRLGYLTNSKVRGKLLKTEKSANTGIFVWADGPSPLRGYAAAVSNQVPSNLTKGTSSGVASAIIFGNFADLLIGMWGVLDLMVDPYSLSTSGGVRVVAFQDVDIAVRHPESFAAMLDALTA